MTPARRRLPAIVAAAIAVGAITPGAPAVASPAAPSVVPPPPFVLAVGAGGDDGRARIQSPGRACDEGGAGAYWHSDHHGALPAGTFLAAPAELHLALEVHSDVFRRPNSVDLPPLTPPNGPPTAFLPPNQSRAVLANERGTIRLTMRAGSCEAPAVHFDGRTAAGTDVPWRVEGGTGAYETVEGIGTLDFAADVDPGADNAWSVALDGELDVAQPELQAVVEEVFWGSLGLDYLTRRVSVRYRLTNIGDGPAFGVRLESTSSSTPGVGALGPHGVTLPDLHAGRSWLVTVRYQLGLTSPCSLVILGCNFVTGMTVAWTDALDRASPATAGNLAVHAPDLPPLLP